MQKIEDFVKFLFKITDQDQSYGIDENELRPLINWLLYFIGENETRRTEKTEMLKAKLEMLSLKQEIKELKNLMIEMNRLPNDYKPIIALKQNQIEKTYENVDDIIKYAFNEYDSNQKGYLSEHDLFEFMKHFFYGYS